jgi:hypothetical protein
MTMLASPDDLKPGFFERTDGAQVRNPGSFGVRYAGISDLLISPGDSGHSWKQR